MCVSVLSYLGIVKSLSNENPIVVRCHPDSNSRPSDPLPNHLAVKTSV